MIRRGVAEGQRDALEHGGSLLAFEEGDTTLVAYALPTGPAAVRGPARLRTDAGFQNSAMGRISRACPCLTWVGDWHVHPMWLPRLSAVDRQTAAEILRNEAAHRSHLVLLLGTAPAWGDAMVLAFVARAATGALAHVERVDLRSVQDDGPEVVRALGHPLRPLAHVLAPGRHAAAKAPRSARARRLPVLAAAPVRPAPRPVVKWLLDVTIGWPLRLLEVAVGGLSYHPLLDEPLLPEPAVPRRRTTMSMPGSKVYALRKLAPMPAPEPRGVVVVPTAVVERLRAAGPDGLPLHGAAEESGGEPFLRVMTTDPHPGLDRLGHGWERRDDVNLGRLDDGALALVVEPVPGATRGGAPLEVVVLDATRYRDRVRALPGAEALLDRMVVLVGLGSVGSDLGARLVRLGVRVVGCDPDRLVTENLVRWGLPVELGHVGRTKAEVWTEVLRHTVPDASVEAHAVDVVRQVGQLAAIVERERPSLLVAATDTADSRRIVNAVAARYGVPALFVALADGAASVRIEVVPDARNGPCHLCAERAEGIAPSGFGGTRRSRTPYASEPEPPPTAVAALPVDVGLGTAVATRIALLLLTGVDPSPWLTHGQQRGNVLFVSLRPDTWVFEEAWDRMVYQVERDRECPVCGDPEADDDL